jgi:hypothetical protein
MIWYFSVQIGSHHGLDLGRVNVGATTSIEPTIDRAMCCTILTTKRTSSKHDRRRDGHVPTTDHHTTIGPTNQPLQQQQNIPIVQWFFELDTTFCVQN